MSPSTLPSLLSSFVSLAGLALAGGCGTSGDRPGTDAGSGPPPDVGLPPPPPPTPLVRLDWRIARGAPLDVTRVATPQAELFALSDDGFVTRSGCTDRLGCSYGFRDRSGALRRQRDQLAQVTSTMVSPDGEKLALVELTTALQDCPSGDAIQLIARGSLQLLDVITGDPRFDLPLRTNLWSAAGFTPDSKWMFAAPNPGAACLPFSTGLLSTAPPFAAPPGLDGNSAFIQEIDDRRWIVFRDHAVGIADPLTAGSFVPIGVEPGKFEVTGGWIHVYFGFGEVVQDLLSVAPGGAIHKTVLRDEDWFPHGSWGRWVRVCGFLRAEGFRDCRVVDAEGEAAPVNFAVTHAPDHTDDAVLLGGDAIAFVGPAPDGGRAVQRIDLRTGRRDVLHLGIGALRPIGDGRGALLVQGGDAWLIEAAHEEKLADHVVSVLSSLRQDPHAPARQDDLAMIIQSPAADQFALSVLDLRTRRLARVTDRLRFTPHGNLPFIVDDDCGQPWTTRHGGGALESFGQVPHHIFFAEQAGDGTPAALWLAPVDLSVPPRRLGTLAGTPARCHAPLTSGDGSRVGYAEDGVDGGPMRITQGHAVFDPPI